MQRSYRDVAPRPPEGAVDLEASLPRASGSTPGETIDGEIEIDIGIGRGRSVFARVGAAPAVRLLALEVRHKWAYRVAERCRREGLSGVVVWAADARELLARCGPEGSVARVFLHFPDPWWKKRHHKRRVLDAELLDNIARILRDDGELFVQTDVPTRAEEMRAAIVDHGMLALHPSTGWHDGNPFGTLSNREVRAIEDGLPVYRILARRVSRPRSR